MTSLAHIDPEQLEAARAHVAANAEKEAAFLAAHPEEQAKRQSWGKNYVPKKDYALGDGGTLDFEFDSLADFAENLYSGATLRRAGFSSDSWALHYFGLPTTHHTLLADGSSVGGGGPAFDLEREGEEGPDVPHHWILCEDTRRTAPTTIRTRAEAIAYAKQWRESHRSLTSRDVAAFVSPGARVVFAIWTDPEVPEAEASAIVRALDDSAEPRFVPVGFPYTIPDVPDELDWPTTRGIYLPAPCASTFSDRKAKPSAAGGAVLRTGLAGLDRQFRTGVAGLPLKARVVIAGPTENAKTTTAVHFAETAREAGWFVVWIAIDEAPEDVEQRLHQRRGAELEPDGFHVLPQENDPFEYFAEQAHREANGRPVLLVVDSLQRLVTRAGEGLGERERIGAAFETITKCQERWPSIVVMTSEIARGSGATKGSGSIDYGATLTLRVHLSGDRLNVTIAKNRYGSKAPLTLTLDRDRQRLLEPEAAAKVERAGELRSAIVAVLRKLGGVVSGARIEAHVEAKGDRVRAELKAMAADGTLTKTTKGYGLAGAITVRVPPASA